MRKLILILLCGMACAQITPNLNFNVPLPGGNINTWGPLIDYNFYSLDNLLSGTTSLPNLTINGLLTTGILSVTGTGSTLNAASVTSSNVNSVRFVGTGTTAWGAGDIGSQLNACIATYSPTQPGVCAIVTGTYALTTTVIKPQWVTIEGQNSVITVASLPSPAIIAANTASLNPSYPGTYARRGISNLTLIGSGLSNTPYGIWLGGDPTNTVISSSASDFYDVFYNVDVQHFGTQYKLGNNVFQETWLVGTIMGGYSDAENGVTCASGITGEENMAWIGTHFASGGGNTGLAVSCPNGYGSTLSFDHLSMDYWGSNNASGCPNSLGTGQISFNGGHLILNAVHMETCSGPQILANTIGLQTEIQIGAGGEFSWTDVTHSLTTGGALQVDSSTTKIDIDPGMLLEVGTNQTISALIANSGTGGQFYCGPYVAFKGSGYYNIPCRSGTWNAGFEATYSGGTISGFDVVSNFNVSGTATSGLSVANQGATQTIGNITLPTGWGTGASTALAGPTTQYTQFNEFAITSGSASFAAAPTVQIVFPTAFPSAPVCNLQVAGVTGTGGNLIFKQTAQSTTQTTFTATLSGGTAFTPAASETYTVVMHCGL
jgi:hypothetical protein